MSPQRERDGGLKQVRDEAIVDHEADVGQLSPRYAGMGAGDEAIGGCGMPAAA